MQYQQVVAIIALVLPVVIGEDEERAGCWNRFDFVWYLEFRKTAWSSSSWMVIIILILFIFGGEVTRGFAFAMLVGVITGTYSSIFVAAPILIDMAKDKPLGEPEHDKTMAKARHSIG